MTRKIYTKGARVLRAEVMIHNAKAYRGRRSLPGWGEIVTRLLGILERFLNAVGCRDACFVADDTLENLPLPAQVGRTKVGGMDFHPPRMRRVTEAVLALSTAAQRHPTMDRDAPPMILRNFAAKRWSARSDPHAATSPYPQGYGP